MGLQCLLRSSPTVQLCCTCYLSCLWLAIRNRLAQAVCACMDQRTRIPRTRCRARSHAPWRKVGKAALQTAGKTQQYWIRQPRGDQEQRAGGKTESPLNARARARSQGQCHGEKAGQGPCQGPRARAKATGPGVGPWPRARARGNGPGPGPVSDSLHLHSAASGGVGVDVKRGYGFPPSNFPLPSSYVSVVGVVRIVPTRRGGSADLFMLGGTENKRN